VIRLTDLRGKEVRTLDGERLGRVHDVHCDCGTVTALMVGPASFIERMTARKTGRRVPWDCVRKMNSKEIVVTPDPPQRRKRR
jgi:sporulation protein YlmC with PRC-barrel domain